VSRPLDPARIPQSNEIAQAFADDEMAVTAPDPTGHLVLLRFTKQLTGRGKYRVALARRADADRRWRDGAHVLHHTQYTFLLHVSKTYDCIPRTMDVRPCASFATQGCARDHNLD
jgi:hypothetical protein